MQLSLPPTLETYFQAYNSGDTEAHLGCFSEDASYFGSMTNAEMSGIESLRGIVAAAQSKLGITALRPIRSFGVSTKIGVIVLLEGTGKTFQTDREAVFVFTLNKSDKIAKLDILWNVR